jgi:NAD dependent epimerase/dehydratase family enzyme
MPPTPEWPWRIIFGEKASVLLEGSRVSADRIVEAGYAFKYPNLKPALENLLH